MSTKVPHYSSWRMIMIMILVIAISLEVKDLAPRFPDHLVIRAKQPRMWGP